MLEQLQRLRLPRLRTWLLACAAVAVVLSGGVGSAQTASDTDLAARSLEYFRTGDCDQAVPLLTQLLEHQPKNVASRKLLAKCLLQQKKWEEARAQFEWVMRDSPTDKDAVDGAKAALIQLQKKEQTAQKQVFETRAASSEQLRSKHELDKASELLRDGDLRAAEPALKKIIAEHPDWAAPRQRLAELYSGSSRFAEAAEIYRGLAESAPSSATVFLHRAAQNYEWADKSGDAIKYYRLYLRRAPGETAARLALAMLLVRDAQYRDAIAELKQVLEQRPDSVPAQLALAQCYERQEQPELALEAYNRVLQLDPNHLVAAAAAERFRRYFDEQPLRRGFAAVDQRDWASAAQAFKEYLASHPNHLETILRIARIYSVNQDFPNARVYYSNYLQQQANDLAIRRELAKMELWAQNYSAAREQWQQLLAAPGATPADYESMIQACVWGGDLAAAEPYAQQLSKMQPGNALASRTLQDLADNRKYAARQHIDRLVLERRFADAIEASRKYMASYGSDPQSQVQICRLYSWARDFGHASDCYHEYLINNPADDVARLELADVDNWSGKYTDAAVQYGKLLQTDPKKTPALLGLAQTMESRREDPIRVQNAFRDVLKADPDNALARQKVEEIHPLVAPVLQISHTSFSDSDDLYWAVQSVALTLTQPGRIKITPYFTSGYFEQQRYLAPQTGSVGAAINSVNQKISEANGIVLANGGGVRIEVAPTPHWSIAGQAGALTFDTGRSTPNGSASLIYRPSSKQSYGISYIHQDAIFDTWTLATLASGIMGDTVLLSSQQTFGEKWRLSMQGGFTSFSRGSEIRFPSNTQRRLWAQLDYPVRSWLRVGYVHRLSSYVSPSPIYFSPELYQVHGLSYMIDRPITDKLRFTNSGEFAYSRTDNNDAFEMSLLPAISWKIGGGFVLEVGYRYSLGQTSAFAVPTYHTQGGEVRLRKVF